MNQQIRLFAALLALSALLVSCRTSRENSIAITNVTVLDMTGASPRARQTVLIVKERIAAIGDSGSPQLPRGTHIVDATGKFLMPGLNDMHIHLTAAGEPDGSRKWMIPMLLANGITGVRDMGGYLESLKPMRKEIEEGKRLGPRIIYAGPYLDGSPPSFEPSFVVTNAVQANEDVAQLVKQGVDFIKVQSILGRDAYFAIAQAAHREKIPFVGHVPDRVTASEAADEGQHSIEHLTAVLRACSNDEAKLMREEFAVPPKKASLRQAHLRIVAWQRELLRSYSEQKAAALIAKFKEKDVWQTPTLVLLKNDAFPRSAEPAIPASRESFLPANRKAEWEKVRTEDMRFVEAPELDLRGRLYAQSAQLVSEMQKAGVKILAGTDSPAPFVIPGFSLHDELAELVAAGLTPQQALQAATRNAAEFLGKENQAGTVAAGKYADLVLLDANPLDDIHNTQRIRAVILRGNFLDRATLDSLLESVRSFVVSQ